MHRARACPGSSGAFGGGVSRNSRIVQMELAALQMNERTHARTHFPAAGRKLRNSLRFVARFLMAEESTELAGLVIALHLERKIRPPCMYTYIMVVGDAMMMGEEAKMI